MNYELVLDPQERETVIAASRAVEPDYGTEDVHQFLYRCLRAAGRLPDALTRALFDLRLGRRGNWMLVRNLPVPPSLPPTPLARGATWTAPTLAARKTMSVVLAHVGHLYNFVDKKHFDYIDDVFPVPADGQAQLGTNSCFLEWHVEDGFHPAKADFVALYCMRGDPNAHTYICEARDLQLQPHHRRQLEQPDFLIRVDPTFASPGEARVHRMAVLTPGDDPEVVYDPAYMEATTPEAQAALEHVQQAIERAYRKVTLQAGDLLLFDNRRVMHARSAYAPAYDGTDRWLLRGLLLESYWKAREHLGDLALERPGAGWPQTVHAVAPAGHALQAQPREETEELA